MSASPSFRLCWADDQVWCEPEQTLQAFEVPTYGRRMLLDNLKVSRLLMTMPNGAPLATADVMVRALQVAADCSWTHQTAPAAFRSHVAQYVAQRAAAVLTIADRDGQELH